MIRVGYPYATAHLPCLSLVLANASEDPSGANVGDVLGVRVVRTGTLAGDDVTVEGMVVTAGTPGTLKVEHEVQIGTDWSSTVEVGCWAVAPEVSLLVQAAARWALFRGKGQLNESGVYEVRFEEGGAQPDPQLEPRVGYVPIIRCHLSWTYQQTRRGDPVPTFFTQTNCFTA
jgi:hypothetical protein